MNSYPKFGTPFKKGSRYFYFHNAGLQQQFVLYTQSSLDAEPTVLLDPNALSEDGTVALRDASFSDDGALMAYQVGGAGVVVCCCVCSCVLLCVVVCSCVLLCVVVCS